MSKLTLWFDDEQIPFDDVTLLDGMLASFQAGRSQILSIGKNKNVKNTKRLTFRILLRNKIWNINGVKRRELETAIAAVKADGKPRAVYVGMQEMSSKIIALETYQSN